MVGLPLVEFDSVRVKELTRHTFSYQIPTIDVSELKRLSSYLKGDVLKNFNKLMATCYWSLILQLT